MTKHAHSTTLVAMVFLAITPACRSAPFVSNPVPLPPAEPGEEKDEHSYDDAVFYALPRTVIGVSAKLTRVGTDAPECAVFNQSVKKEAQERKQALAQPLQALANARANLAAAKHALDATAKAEKNLEEAVKTAEEAVENTASAHTTGLIEAYEKAGLGLDDLPVRTDGTEHVYGMSDLKLSSFAEPDPDAVYAIALRGLRGRDRKLAIELTKDGTLAGSSQTTVDLRGEIAAKVTVETLAAVAKVAGSFLGLGAPADSVKATSDQWMSERCGQTLMALGHLVKERTDLPTQAHVFGAGGTTVATIMADMDARIARLRVSFTGEKKLETSSVICFVRPQTAKPGAAEVEEHELWAFDKDKGIHGKSSACHVPLSFMHKQKAGGTAAPKDTVILKLERSDDIDGVNKKVADATEASGDAMLHYRFPGRANVSVSKGEELLWLPEPLRIAQYGTVQEVPASTKLRYLESSFVAHDDTGGLKSLTFKGGSDGKSVPDIGKLGDSVVGVVDAVGKKREKDAGAAEAALRADVMMKVLEACEAALAAGTDPAVCELR